MIDEDFRDKTTAGLAILSERSESQSKALEQIGTSLLDIASGEHCIKGKTIELGQAAANENRKSLWKYVKNGRRPIRSGKPKTWPAVFWELLEDPAKARLAGLAVLGFILLKMHGIDPISLVSKIVEAVKLAQGGQ